MSTNWWHAGYLSPVSQLRIQRPGVRSLTTGVGSWMEAVGAYLALKIQFEGFSWKLVFARFSGTYADNINGIDVVNVGLAIFFAFSSNLQCTRKL